MFGQPPEAINSTIQSRVKAPAGCRIPRTPATNIGRCLICQRRRKIHGFDTANRFHLHFVYNGGSIDFERYLFVVAVLLRPTTRKLCVYADRPTF